MKIYSACAEPFNLKLVRKVLLSYYDLGVTDMPFRKDTLIAIKDESKEKRLTRSSGNSKAGVS